MQEITLEKLLEVGAHFGHQAKRWNPRMSQYIYAQKDGVHIFDLAKTREALVSALEVLKEASKEGKTILFVGTKKQVKQKLVDVALKTGSFYIKERWLGGTLTNFNQILLSVKKMADLKEKLASGHFSNYTKKERLLIERDIEKLEKFLGGVSEIKKTPDLMVIIDIHKENGAVTEANKLKIPTIGVVDSNSDPNLVTYPIPMNDDASLALEYVMDLFEEAILEGKNPTKTTSTKKTVKKVKVKREVDSEEEQLEVVHQK